MIYYDETNTVLSGQGLKNTSQNNLMIINVSCMATTNEKLALRTRDWLSYPMLELPSNEEPADLKVTSIPVGRAKDCSAATIKKHI